MRFSVRQADVCAGEEKRILRKSAFCVRVLTEKCILCAACDGKAHSGCGSSRKSALCDPQTTQTALFREAAGHHPVREPRDVARPVDVVLHGPEQQCLHFKIVSVFYWHPVSTETRMLLIPRVRLGATYLLGRWDP